MGEGVAAIESASDGGIVLWVARTRSKRRVESKMRRLVIIGRAVVDVVPQFNWTIDGRDPDL